MIEKNLRQILCEIGNENGIEAAALMAVVEVESGGRLLANVLGKQEPLIRFEGHYFYRLLGLKKRNQAVVKGLASPKAGKIRNPNHQQGRWSLIRRAMVIDRPCALQSTSWGAGQVMGAHWRWLGYASIDAFVARARKGVDGQLEVMIRYIKKAGLMDAIHNHDWRGFARGYNGPQYARYGYDLKLEKAYQQYKQLSSGSGFKQNPDSSTARHRPFIIKFGDHGPAVHQLQRDLASKGFMMAIDGDFGPMTRKAVLSFQRQEGLKEDGIVGPKTFIALQKPLNLLEIDKSA